MDTETLLHRSVAMYVLLQPVLPATFRMEFVSPPGDSEALARVGDVPHGAEVLLSFTILCFVIVDSSILERAAHVAGAIA